MITGIVAQEFPPLPKGTLASLRAYLDADSIYTTVIRHEGEALLFPPSVLDDDEFPGSELPQVLTSDAVVNAWSGDTEFVFPPFVSISRQMLPQFYSDFETVFLPDIRIPGYLLPPFLDSPDIIYATPLILDGGMLRAELYNDFEAVFEPLIDAALTFYPSLVLSPDAIYAPSAKSGVIGPPFLLGDDTFFPFASKIGYFPSFFIDTGEPARKPTNFDGLLVNTVLTPDKLTAAHDVVGNYHGAQSTVYKDSGKWYFEVLLGPTHGINDASGIVREGIDFFTMSQKGPDAILVYNWYPVNGIGDVYASGIVVVSNAWWVQFAGFRTGGGSYGTLIEGDHLGFAFDFTNKKCWVRLNGGPWNNNQLGTTVLPNQDPVLGIGGVPIPNGRYTPGVLFGAQAGHGQYGQSGDNFTANFGAKNFRFPAPAGYKNWEIPSPFGPVINGDSVGSAIIGLPAKLDGARATVSMSADELTATHLTTGTDAGANSNSLQNCGKYYFEVKALATHGNADCVGLMLLESNFNQVVSGGVGCAVINMAGAFKGVVATPGSGIGSTIGAGDVIRIAVDLNGQTSTWGGNIWFRRNNGPWNGSVAAIPEEGSGAGGLTGYNFRKFWIPCVCFGGQNATVGDAFESNFGQRPFAFKPPGGFGVWTLVLNEFVRGLAPAAAVQDADEQFFPPFADTYIKNMYHPGGAVFDDDTIFGPSSFGGNLPLFVDSLVVDQDAIFSPGYLATLDTSSPTVTISADRRTATVNAGAPNFVGARSNAQKIFGKYYFEATYGKNNEANNVGIMKESGTYNDIGSQGYNGTWVSGGNTSYIYSNNGLSGKTVGSAIQAGDIIGIAINLDLRRGWFRKAGTSGLWNNTAGADPVANTGGVVIESLASFAPIVEFLVGNSASVNDAITLNFGSAQYADPPPTGFGNWSGVSTSLYLVPSAPLPSDDAFPIARLSPANLNAGFVDDTLVESVPLISASGGNPTIGPQTLVRDDLTDAVYAPTLSIILASFDPASATAITLSNGNLTATHVGATSPAGVKSNSFKVSGKWYFEVTATLVRADSDDPGIIALTTAYGTVTGFGQGCTMINRWNGAVYSNNGSSFSLGAVTNGDNIGFAIDLTARRAWVRKNGGNWLGQALASQNPNTGVGGVVIAQGAFAPMIVYGGAGTLGGENMTANFGGLPFAFTKPTGFSEWPAYSQTLVTLEGGLIANTTLSANKLVATHSAAATNSGAMCAFYKSTGKYYHESTFGPTHGSGDCVGVSGSALSNVVGGGSNCILLYASDGSIWITGVSPSGNLGPCVQGDIVSTAVDLTAHLGWIRKNGGNWNGSPTANPATGVGGFGIANVLMAPVVGFGGSANPGQVGDSASANFGQSAYAFAAPAGFGNWMT